MDLTPEQIAKYRRRVAAAHCAIALSFQKTWRCPECQHRVKKAISTSACPTCGASLPAEPTNIMDV